MKKYEFKKLTPREKQIAITTLALGLGLIIFAIVATVLLKKWGVFVNG